MTRAIKFRAWDGKKMQQVHLLGLHWELEKNPPIYIDMSGSEDVPHYSDCPLMQYTGLKDKNGVEIYEGDVVLAPDGKRWEIAYRGDRFLLRNGLPGEPIDVPYSIPDCEVIGNIYENPELEVSHVS